jgi:hypothetical protein
VELNKPVAGYYKRRFVRNGPWVPVRFWKGAPLDPVTGEELERGHRWQCSVDGRHVTDETEVLEQWLGCAGHKITLDEFKLMRRKTAAALYDNPTAPEANPGRAVDVRRLAPILPPRRD